MEKKVVKEYDKMNDSVYEGEFLNDLRHGKGKCYINDKLVFDGEFCYGQKKHKM